jgi:hypothetical protein
LQFGGHPFCTGVFVFERLLSGLKTPVSKMPEWALFRVSGSISTPMRSGHFAGFSKIARIGKPGHN